MAKVWTEIKKLADMNIPEPDELTVEELMVFKEASDDQVDAVCHAYRYGYQRHRIAAERKILDFFNRFLL